MRLERRHGLCGPAIHRRLVLLRLRAEGRQVFLVILHHRGQVPLSRPLWLLLLKAALAALAAVIAASALVEAFAIGMRPALQGADIAIAVVIGGLLVARALGRSS